MLFTIGHSNHTLDKFIELLKYHNIRSVFDVRSAPYSRWVPHFNQRSLASTLQEYGIFYKHIPELGGRPQLPHLYPNGHISYELYIKEPLFLKNIKNLLSFSGDMVVIMCSEGDPLVCHRGLLISPILNTYGEQVIHILSDGSLEDYQQSRLRLIRETKAHSAEEAFKSRWKTIEKKVKLSTK
jgi:uncharacterized protein (DUF488 family)